MAILTAVASTCRSVWRDGFYCLRQYFIVWLELSFAASLSADRKPTMAWTERVRQDAWINELYYG
jgi:hypothetical protein